MLAPSKIAQPVIRPLRANKAEACAHLHAESFAHPWSTEDIEALIADPATVGAAALDPANALLRGFAIARVAGDEAEILTIAVAANLRGRAVGRALLETTLRCAANEGAKTIFLEVAEDNPPALSLYRRAGFEEVGKRPGYYRRANGAPANAVIMRKALR